MTLLLLAASALVPWILVGGLSHPARLRARERWLWASGWVALAWLLSVEPFLALAALPLWFSWRGPRDQGRVLALVAIVLTWFAALALAPSARTVIWAWAVGGAVHGLLVAGHWTLLRTGAIGRGAVLERLPHAGSTFGHRTMAAGFLALALPAALATAPWWLAPTILAGLWVTFSWVALLAVAAGCILWFASWPSAIGISGAVVTVAAVIVVGRLSHRRWGNALPRGDSLDSLWSRWNACRVLWRCWRPWPFWLLGLGVGGAIPTLSRAHSTWTDLRPTLSGGHAHNDFVEWVAETGVLGLAAVVAFLLRVLPAMRLGDALSAIVATGLVLVLGTYPLRIPPLALTWWIAAGLLAGRA